MSFLRSTALKGLAVVVCAMSGFAVSAQAADELSLNDRSGFYGVVKGGYAFVDTQAFDVGPVDLNPDEAYMIAGGAGYYFGALRVEGEAAYFWGSQDDSIGSLDADLDLSVLAPMVNVFYDIPLADRFTGYVGAGIGWGFGEAELNVDPIGFSEDESDDDFALQFMAGLGYQIADHVTLTGGYRGFCLTTDDAIWLHTIEIGLRFDF